MGFGKLVGLRAPSELRGTFWASDAPSELRGTFWASGGTSGFRGGGGVVPSGLRGTCWASGRLLAKSSVHPKFVSPVQVPQFDKSCQNLVQLVG